MASPAYKTTSQDRRRKRLPLLPDDIFRLIMSHRSKSTRLDALLPTLRHHEEELDFLMLEFWDEMWDDEHDRDDLIKAIKDLKFKVRVMHNRMKQIDTDQTIWEKQEAA